MDKEKGKRVFYKYAMLDVSKHGRRKVFAFREENEGEYKYYSTNKLDMTPRIACKHIRKRWSIENMHRSLKQYFGLQDCYSDKEDTMRSHFSLSYLLLYIFSVFLAELRDDGERKTMERLWRDYIFEREAETSLDRRMLHERDRMMKVT